MDQSSNPYNHLIQELAGHKYFHLSLLKDDRLVHLPYSIKILLEQAIRNCDNFNVKQIDVERILDWQNLNKKEVEVQFKPARVLLQDFTGVPLVCDLAAMRTQTSLMGQDPQLINPLCPVDLVIDHSVQVDFSGSQDSLDKNEETEFNRNFERFQFLKWGSKAFQNFKIVPPGSGIVHQVNLEYLARVVFMKDGFLYPDSVVGTDSHTTMINGLGVLGWGVGGIEAEANMLGETTSLVLPQVVGFKLTGKLNQYATATDLVLRCVEMLRQKKVVGKFVEFYGEGVRSLSLPDRATISNMAPEYGATMGFFPVDSQTLSYLKQTGRTQSQCEIVEQYLRAQGLFVEEVDEKIQYSDTLELDLATVEPCVAGPKRPQDRVPLSTLKEEFIKGLTQPVSFKGFNVQNPQLTTQSLHQGSVVIAAITSCTNTSNPGAMLAAGLVAKRAVEKGLTVQSWVKTSLSPGSQAVTKYYEKAGLTPFLEKVGFHTTGYGCMTCIGNSGPISEEVTQQIDKDLVVCAVLSGNRNFEGRVHPLTRANYLASPPLVVAFALAGRVDIDFEKEPIQGDIYLRDIWPTRDEVKQLEEAVVTAEVFTECYSRIAEGTKRWNEMQVNESLLYDWHTVSTYIHQPPFFQGLTLETPPYNEIKDAFCLANFGDSITTDHISPAGNISTKSPAADYLKQFQVEAKDFNTYGARRGNDEVMLRGTFANVRLKNKMLNGKEGPFTIHLPSKEEVTIYEAARRYGFTSTVVLGGSEYGSGSSRDWAAKGPFLMGVKAVVAVSFERIHRSNLAGMGILPLEFTNGETADSLKLTGFEKYTVVLPKENLKVNQIVEVIATNEDGSTISFKTLLRLDTDVEIQYFLHGGILQYVLRKILGKKQ